jgi:solute carrier family 25 (adenine nucleotide translocator) protein 4/5/6/31
MSPIERVKILMQTQDSNPKIISGEEKRYTGLGDCFKRVQAEQGFKAFWRGNFVNCLRYAPQQGSALAFNDTIRTLTPKFDPVKDVYAATAASLISGGMAGAAANSICYPFDFARTRLASDVGSGKKMFNGIGDCIMKTVKNQGIVGLYRGWAITCAGAFVYRGGQLGLFSQIMAMNPYKDDKGPFGLVVTFIAATAGRTAVMPFNYPFDTVRRRLMLESEKPAADRIYKSGVDCFFKVLKAEGLAGMYKGMVPELFRGVGGSVVLVAYNRIKVYLGI